MAFSACTPRVVAAPPLLLPPSSSSAAAFPRRSVVPCTIRRGEAAERGVRAMVVVKKYKGTRMREKRLGQMIEQKVQEAREACAGDEGSDECRVAWDEVEEVSGAKANLRRRLAEGDRDPLEPFCAENPHSDECLVYDD